MSGVPRLFESCIDSHDGALASGGGGAGRVELCARLDVGGTTPDAALIARCVASLAIPVFVMIRPRGGDFVYDAGEVAAMVDDIRAAAAAGAHGVVFGALGRDATIDAAIMRRLVDVARPLPVTCHKAIDATRDPIEALEALLALGVDRVLTSGGADTAVNGAATIARMVARAGDALVVMAGGGVRAHDVAAIVQQTGVREVHARIVPAGVPAGVGAALVDAWRADVAQLVRALPRRQGF
jgi:copper homeostasis protein